MRYNPNPPATLDIDTQNLLWLDIKAAQAALESRRAFLASLSESLAARTTDAKALKLEAILGDLWRRFRIR